MLSGQFDSGSVKYDGNIFFDFLFIFNIIIVSLFLLKSIKFKSHPTCRHQSGPDCQRLADGRRLPGRLPLRHDLAVVAVDALVLGAVGAVAPRGAAAKSGERGKRES